MALIHHRSSVRYNNAWKLLQQLVCRTLDCLAVVLCFCAVVTLADQVHLDIATTGAVLGRLGLAWHLGYCLGRRAARRGPQLQLARVPRAILDRTHARIQRLA
jgi:hypothetical protein